MDLEYVENFEKIHQRYHAWWNCEIIDRPPVWIEVKNRANLLPKKDHPSFREKWFDAEYQVDCVEADISNREFVGDTIPFYIPNLGPDICATLFGAELEFAQDTSWAHPYLKSSREVLDIKPDFDNQYWQKIKEITLLSLERGKGKWLTGVTDLHTNGDLLVGLRGPESLCLEVIDDPEGVKKACDYVTGFFSQIYEDLNNIINVTGQPCLTWTPSLYSGKMYVTSCDFICLISPSSFKDIILPSIVEEMRYLDKNIFHLDGPGALRHLETLLEVPELDALQWVYGAGNEPASKWIEVYQRAQASGKSIEIICDGIEDAIEVSKHIQPEGTWFKIDGIHSKEDAQAFIKYIEAWAANKK